MKISKIQIQRSSDRLLWLFPLLHWLVSVIGAHAGLHLLKLLKFKHFLLRTLTTFFCHCHAALCKLPQLMLGGNRARSSMASRSLRMFLLLDHADRVWVLLHLFHLCEDAELIVYDWADRCRGFVRHAVGDIVLCRQVMRASAMTFRFRLATHATALKLISLICVGLRLMHLGVGGEDLWGAVLGSRLFESQVNHLAHLVLLLAGCDSVFGGDFVQLFVVFVVWCLLRLLLMHVPRRCNCKHWKVRTRWNGSDWILTATDTNGVRSVWFSERVSVSWQVSCWELRSSDVVSEQ